MRVAPLHLGDGRKVWDLLTDERSRQAVVIAERYADGDATDEELSAAARDAADAAWDAARAAADEYAAAASAASAVADAAAAAATCTAYAAAAQAAYDDVADAVRAADAAAPTTRKIVAAP